MVYWQSLLTVEELRAFALARTGERKCFELSDLLCWRQLRPLFYLAALPKK